MIAVQPWKHVNYFQILLCLSELGAPFAECKIRFTHCREEDAEVENPTTQHITQDQGLELINQFYSAEEALVIKTCPHHYMAY